MEINRSGTRDSQKGPAAHFTGTVRIDPLFQPNGVQHCTFGCGLVKVTDEQYGAKG